MKPKNRDCKRSIGSFSVSERKESRTKAMSNAVSSKATAVKFLKDAGILNKNGVVAVQYRSK